MDVGINIIATMKDIDNKNKISMYKSFQNTVELKKKANQVKRQAKRRLEEKEELKISI